jgi:carboxylate-amine ligase
MVGEGWCSYQQQKKIDTEMLSAMLDDIIKNGMKTEIKDKSWLALFNIPKSVTAQEMLQWFLSRLMTEGPFMRWSKNISTIIEEGNLSTRIQKSLKNDTSVASIQHTWKRLANCLDSDTMFIP